MSTNWRLHCDPQPSSVDRKSPYDPALLNTARTPSNNPTCSPRERQPLGELKVVLPTEPRKHTGTENRSKPVSNPAWQRLQANRPRHGPLIRSPFPRSHKHTIVADHDVPAIMYDKKYKRYYNKLECYKITDELSNVFAAKVISKSTLRDNKNRTKLFAEINIHRSMRHRTIVRFIRCFEDTSNVYLIVELCPNKTLVEMLRRRGCLTEPEVRYYLIQILDACRYMHDNRVIHRDIKLSNVFLDENMDVKVGDFGLAALLVNPSDRKKTVCGTPNYIAPEILFGKSGHDYKVDMWSIGVLMYTLLTGRHPFQQDEIKGIYQKIKENSEATSYEYPPNCNISDDAKDLISQLLVNEPVKEPTIKDLCSTITPPHPMDSPGKAAEALRRAMAPNASYEDLSPIGPLKLMSENIPDPRSQFPGKLETPTKESKAKPESTTSRKRSNPFVDDGKAKRIAAENNREIPATKPRGDRSKSLEKPPSVPLQDASNKLPQKKREASPKAVEYQNLRAVQQPKESQTEKTVSLLLAMANTIEGALKNKAKAPRAAVHTERPWCTENVFVDRWIDFTGKYGLGYELSDGTRGVLFNDQTSMTTNDNTTFLYNNPCSHEEKIFNKADTPENLKKKVHLIQKFKQYMDKHLSHVAADLPEPSSTITGVILSQFMVNEESVVFRLNNDVIQVNFFKRLKLILYEAANQLVYIDDKRQLLKYSLSDAVASDDERLITALWAAQAMLVEQANCSPRDM
ncbi:Cell cycle serine/threonine-protein kinase cdc5/MSD2 [Apophysomyces ossiformis]|uniref:Cell cycle serine/threonine-protein kinase cdc5/MSD2 n=1 Tax=Apophysomyces ossiformis TaxID=679940 RepID=A0A8H7BQG8_9FUNG|nr:Cell cycle serine/threonine-protein kinase cdc5/MSD2 [Apophysomyces ossiformis]